MLKVRQLALYTRAFHPKIIANAQNVRTIVTEVTEGKDSEGDKYRNVKVTALTREKGKDPQYVDLQFYGPKTPDALVWAICTCEYFKFTCEVALEKQGSSEIVFSNGQSPVVRNPRQVPCACKHIIAALRDQAYKAKK